VQAALLAANPSNQRQQELTWQALWLAQHAGAAV
jgi:hypothetical protein